MTHEISANLPHTVLSIDEQKDPDRPKGEFYNRPQRGTGTSVAKELFNPPRLRQYSLCICYEESGPVRVVSRGPD